MEKITLGDVEISRVVELRDLAMPRAQVFPSIDRQRWVDDAELLVPNFWRPDTDEFVVNTQPWVLRSAGRTIMIDTGFGNDKQRPNAPALSNLHTDFLDRMATAGFAPEDIDVVVCTHLHSDHVGWNTRLVDGQWVPTFPNARYLIAQADFDYWHPVHGDPNRSPRMAGVFEDSVAPVYEAGLVDLWSDEYAIDANLRLVPAPGHTPGAAVVELRSGGDRALFVGDLVHSPVQLGLPECGPAFDEDSGLAAKSRVRVLAQAAAERALLVPAHFPAGSAVEIRAVGDGFTATRWAFD
ncbi:MAG TPA: MBL fold metallo-hydrolase [Pseudonocardiaceae bacterium]|nr:MBL fold metallo-hydrolase [Pseudonocardiaceae bacterium]